MFYHPCSLNEHTMHVTTLFIVYKARKQSDLENEILIISVEKFSYNEQ